MPSDHLSSRSDARSIEAKEKETVALLIAVVGAIVSIWFYRNGTRFYRTYFEEIYLAGLGIVSLISAATLYKFTKFNRATLDRFRKLLPFAASKNGVFTGRTTDGVRIFIPDEKRTGHVQIIGSTGRGKTESVILPWIVRDLRKGKSAVLIDGKGDSELKDLVQAHAIDIRTVPSVRVITLDLSDPKRSHRTNPLRYGSPTEITDRLFRSLVFQDQFYKQVQYRECLSVVELLHAEGSEVTIAGIYELLTNRVRRMEKMKITPNEALKTQLTRSLSVSEKEREERTLGLISQIEPLTKGELGEILNSKIDSNLANEDGESLDFSLSEVFTGDSSRQAVVIISIPTLKFQESGRILGKILLQEIAWSVGHRSSTKGRNDMIPVFLDEFSAFVYDGFIDILNKARSANVPLHLSQQSLGDFEAISPAFAKSVNTNTNVKVLLGLNDPESADFFARHLGTTTTEKVTERGTESGGLLRNKRERSGDVSIREVESYKIHPNRLKNFSEGRGVLHFPSGNGFFTEEVQFERLG